MFFIYRWLYHQFAFSRGQSNGFLILIPLSLIFMFSLPLYRTFRQGEEDFSKESRFLDSLYAVHFQSEPPPELQFFDFNPNTASADELGRLGFSPAVTSRIVNYVSKGGTFRNAQDMLRIWGVDSSHLLKLQPFVRIPEKERIRTTVHRQKKEDVVQVSFDLNVADSTQLMGVYGVGPKLSIRIIRYRDALGGFWTKDQLYEVYGLDSVVIDRIKKRVYIAEDFSPKKLDLNAIDRQALAGHPYLSSREAAAIVAYRFKHGNFTAVAEIGRAAGLDSVRIAKLIPYLTAD